MLVLAPDRASAAYTSLFKWNGFGAPDDFIGLDNFTRLLQRRDLPRRPAGAASILIVLSLVVQLPVALGLALLLNQPLRGRAVYRLMFFAPYVLSEVTTAVLFTHGLLARPTAWPTRCSASSGSDGLARTGSPTRPRCSTRCSSSSPGSTSAST